MQINQPSSKSTGFSWNKFFKFFLFFACSTLFSLPALVESCSFSFLIATILLSSCLRSFNLPSISSPLIVFLGASVFAVNVFLAGLVFSEATCPLAAFYKIYKNAQQILYTFNIKIYLFFETILNRIDK